MNRIGFILAVLVLQIWSSSSVYAQNTPSSTLRDSNGMFLGPPYGAGAINYYLCEAYAPPWATTVSQSAELEYEKIDCTNDGHYTLSYTVEAVLPPYQGQVATEIFSGTDLPPGYSVPIVATEYPWVQGKTLGKNCDCAGDPINLATGNEFREDVDFDIGDLSFHRYYNSASSARTEHIGIQWLNTFDRKIEYWPGGANIATAHRQDGHSVDFISQSGAWVADPDVSDRLVENTDSTGALVGWTYFDSSTRNLETYDSSGTLISIQSPDGLTTNLAYSNTSTPSAIAPAPGLLIQVTDPYGRSLNFIYNSNSEISEAILPDGGIVTYAYDSGQNLQKVTYPDQTSKQYVYNESSLTNGGSLPSNLTGVIDEAGQRYASIGYNQSGTAIMSMLGSGFDKVQLGYEFQNKGAGPTTVTYPLGAAVAVGFAVNPYGTVHVTSVNSPCEIGCNQLYASTTFDSNGYLSSATDFNGNVTKTIYDSNGLLNQKVEAAGTSSQRSTSTTWNSTLRVPLTREVLDANNNIVNSTQWVYNTTGQPLARCEIDPNNSAAAGYSCSISGTVPAGVRRWLYTYCTAVGAGCPLSGLLVTLTGPRTDLTQTTTYSYYLAASAVNCGTPGAACHQPGDLYQVTDALGHVTTVASYDADGRITRETDANGVNTDMTYTPRGWLASRSVGGATTGFTYTPYGAVQTVTDPDGVTTTYGYDAAHRLTKVTDALGNYIQYTLDAAGNKTGEQVYDASGILHKQVTRTFNTLGQLTTVVDGLNATVFNASTSGSYDANGNLVQSSDGLGIQRQQSYDALNRLVKTLDNYNGTDTTTANTTSQFAYDSLDRLTQVTDPSNLATSYSYDGLDDATGQASPDTGSTSRTFDAAGNVLTRTDAKGVMVTNAYDTLDRLAATTYPDATQNVAYHYDEANSVTGCSSSSPVGRLTRIVENTVTTVYCYDAQGRVIEKQQITGTATDTTGYAYTAAGRLGQMMYPSGTLVTYARDGDGRIQSLSITPHNGTASTAVSSVTWQPFGPVSGYTLGNRQAVTRSYDANYRLTDFASPTFSLHVTRDAMGDITAIGKKAGFKSPSETYSYDPLRRLTTITEANGSALQSVTYNPTGDRLSKAGSGLDTGAYSYNVNTHQLVATGSYARAFDADGNTTAITAASGNLGFGYNDRNRMIVAQLAGSTVANYTYDALGERIQKVAGTASERYGYDEGQQLLSEQGATNRDYVWMDGIPVANVDTTGATSTIAYVTADQLGTPRAIANASGTTEWTWPYAGNAWGESAPTSSGYTYNLRFPGQYYDQETGLAYNVNRYYETATGRYIESDPIGLDGGISTYAFVSGRPLGLIDSLGLIEWSGTYGQGGLVIGAGAIGASFDLISDCVDGKKAEIEVSLLTGAAGIGPKWSALAGDRGKVKFHDASETIDPERAAGPAGIFGVGATVVKLSIGYTRIRLGHLYSDSVDSVGLDVGATAAVGSSWVTKTTWSKCGCGH